jgi:multiple sugar transport system substrate-binding protein
MRRGKMKVQRVFSWSATLLTVGGLILAACAPSATPTPEVIRETTIIEVTSTPAPAGPVTITFWHGYNEVETEMLDGTVIPAFEAAHPDITVEALNVPYDEFRRKLLTAIAGGTAPDLIRADIAWVPEFADMGALARLDEVMPDFEDFAASVFPGPLSTNYLDGSYYGLPLDTNTRVFVYNEDMFEAAGVSGPPETIEEFLDICERISALGEGKYCFADGGTYAWAMNPWIWSFGGDVTDPDITTASGYYNGPQTLAAYEFLRDLMERGYLHPGQIAGGLDTWGLFGRGEVAMILEGPWFPPSFAGMFPDMHYGMALMPAGEGGPISVVGGEDIVIFQQSQHKEAAAEFIRFMLSEDTQLTMADAGQMPVLSSADVATVALGEHPYFGIFLEQLQTSRARTPHPAWPQMEEILTNTSAAILSGQADAQEALDEAAAQMDALLSGQ